MAGPAPTTLSILQGPFRRAGPLQRLVISPPLAEGPGPEGPRREHPPCMGHRGSPLCCAAVFEAFVLDVGIPRQWYAIQIDDLAIDDQHENVVIVDLGFVPFAGASEVAGSAVELVKGYELIRTPAFIELPLSLPFRCTGFASERWEFPGS